MTFLINLSGWMPTGLPETEEAMFKRGSKLSRTIVCTLAALMLMLVTAPAAHAAPPTFSGCENIEDGRPRVAFDSSGRWVEAILKYRCNTGKEYSILGTLYQNPDSQGGTKIGSALKEGISTTPYLYATWGNCRSTSTTDFNVAYSITILGVKKYYQTPVYALACRF